MSGGVLARKCTGLFLVAGLFLAAQAAFADGKGLTEEVFDRDLEYKIYFSGNNEYTNAIENVLILGFEEIAGRLFLVVQSRGFSITREKGYVLFDSVTAIIPDRDLKVNRIQKTTYTNSN